MAESVLSNLFYIAATFSMFAAGLLFIVLVISEFRR